MNFTFYSSIYFCFSVYIMSYLRYTVLCEHSLVTYSSTYGLVDCLEAQVLIKHWPSLPPIRTCCLCWCGKTGKHTELWSNFSYLFTLSSCMSLAVWSKEWKDKSILYIPHVYLGIPSSLWVRVSGCWGTGVQPWPHTVQGHRWSWCLHSFSHLKIRDTIK